MVTCSAAAQAAQEIETEGAATGKKLSPVFDHWIIEKLGL